MPTKKHPILRGLLGLILFLIVFFALLAAVSSLWTGTGDLALSDKVAILPITGVISDSQPIIEQLHKYRDSGKVKAIVVRIDSPGGGVGPAQEIYEEVKKIRREKPVVASLGSVGASGGYYVACAAEKIIANPGTILGSIGVIVEYPNVEELLKKIGLKGVVIKSGKYKDILSPLRDMTEEERGLVQNVIDDIQGQFVSAVAEGRRLERARVGAIADGRIFSGAQAKAIGLVDEMGNLSDAIALAAKMGGIKGKPTVLYPEKDRFSFLDRLASEMLQSFGQSLWRTLQFKYLLPPGP